MLRRLRACDPQAANQGISRYEAKDAIPTGARRRRPIPRRSSRVPAAMPSQRICVLAAAVQVAPILRIPPRLFFKQFITHSMQRRPTLARRPRQGP
jgi:hypothetical protein